MTDRNDFVTDGFISKKARDDSHNSKLSKLQMIQKCLDVASDVGVNFKNVGILSIESSLFHLFHYTFLQTKHQRKGY